MFWIIFVAAVLLAYKVGRAVERHTHASKRHPDTPIFGGRKRR